MGQPVNEASQKHRCEGEDDGLAAPAPDNQPSLARDAFRRIVTAGALLEHCPFIIGHR
jgi:hypothetical protein